MRETLHPGTPILKWKEPPHNFWEFIPQFLLFATMVVGLDLPWWGFKHLLTFCGLTLRQGEILLFGGMPPYMPWVGIGAFRLLQLIAEHRDMVSGPLQVIHSKPLSSLPPSAELVVIGGEFRFSEKMKKCALGFLAAGVLAYVIFAWPLYNKGWVNHSLAFELLAIFGAIIGSFFMVVVPDFVKLVRRLTFRIDTEGVTSRTLRGMQFVPWEQIVTCKMVRSRDRLEGETILVFTLQDYHRKTLLTRSLYVSEATLTQISQTMLRMLSVA